jgi:hypothetical protein
MLLWTAFCVLCVYWLSNPGTHGLFLYLIFLGPMPPLLLVWTEIACWVLAFAIVILLSFVRLTRGTYARSSRKSDLTWPDKKKNELWVPLWLFRASLGLWWCLGCGLTLSLAWWVPRQADYFQESAWIKAFGLGLFLLVCLGLLLEYSLPLLGRPEPKGRWRRDQSWGPLTSACAALLALIPALWLPTAEQADNSGWRQARAVLIDEPVLLNLDNEEIDIPVPALSEPVKRVYVVSHIQDGAQMVQTQALAMLAINMEYGLPNFQYLRAGIDTADQDLGQIRIKTSARHQAPALADYKLSFSPEGQAYHRQNYLTGFFLNIPGAVASISFHYMSPLDQDPEKPFPQLVIEKIFLE